MTGDCLDDFVKSGFLAFDLITSSVRLCSDQKQRPCQFLSFALQQGGFCGHPPASFSNRLPQPCRFQDKILLWLLHGRRRHRSVDRPVLPPKASGPIAFSMNHWRCRCLKFSGKRHKKESMVSGNRCKPNAEQSSLGYAEAAARLRCNQCRSNKFVGIALTFCYLCSLMPLFCQTPARFRIYGTCFFFVPWEGK